MASTTAKAPKALTVDDDLLSRYGLKSMVAPGQPLPTVAPTADDFAASGPALTPKYPATVGTMNQNPGGDAIARATNMTMRPPPGQDPRALSPVPASIATPNPDAYALRSLAPAPAANPASPAPIAPATSYAGPMIGPPGPRDLLATHRSNLNADDQTALGRMSLIDSKLNHGNLSPEDRAALGSERLSLAMARGDRGRELSNLNVAMHPPTAPAPVGEEAFRNSRASLFQTGRDQQGALVKSLNDRLSDPTLTPAARAALNEQFRQASTAYGQFGNLADNARSGAPGQPTAAGSNSAQAARFARESGANEDAVARAMRGESSYQLGRATSSTLARNAAGTAVAQSASALADAQDSADPALRAQDREARLAAAQAAAIAAKSQVATAGAGAASAGAAAAATTTRAGSETRLAALADPQFTGNIDGIKAQLAAGPSWTGRTDQPFGASVDKIISDISSRSPEEQAALKEYLRQNLDLQQRFGLQGLGGAGHWAVVKKLREFVGRAAQ